MSLVVNHNISAMNTLRNLESTSTSLSKSLQKLSSGYKINVAADDPAGLIISEKLRAQLTGLDRCVRNSQEASNIVGIAEGALIEANSVLKSVRALTLHAANTGATTPEQIVADQSEIDSAVDSIKRIAETTRYADRALLDGTAGNTFEFDPLYVSDFQLNQLNLSQDDAATWLQVSAMNITTQAERAEVSTDAISAAGVITAATFTVTISGNKGTADYAVTLGDNLSDAVNEINDLTATTGVSAVVDGDAIKFLSEEYGAGQYVSVVDQSGNQNILDAALANVDGFSDEGVDIAGTLNIDQYDTTFNDMTGGPVVNVAGDNALAFTGRGLTVLFDGYLHDSTNAVLAQKTSFRFDVSAGLNATAPVNFTPATGVLDVGGGSLTFQLTEGTDVTKDQVQFAFSSLLPGVVGAYEDGGNIYHLEDIKDGELADLATDPLLALKIIDAAIDDVSSERARLGSFQKNTLDTNINSLRVAVENITSTESSIRDANIAQETTDFTKNQILMQAGTAMLAQANVASQNVLQLLR